MHPLIALAILIFLPFLVFFIIFILRIISDRNIDNQELKKGNNTQTSTGIDKLMDKLHNNNINNK